MQTLFILSIHRAISFGSRNLSEVFQPRRFLGLFFVVSVAACGLVFARSSHLSEKSLILIDLFEATEFAQAVRVPTQSFSTKLGPPRIMRSPHTRVESYSAAEEKDAPEIIKIIEKCWKVYEKRGRPLPSTEITIVLYPTVADFMSATKKPEYVVAATTGSTISMQPPALVRSRGGLKGTLRHEFAHAVTHSIPEMDAPLWLREGVAIYMSGQGELLPRNSKIKFEDDLDLDRAIESPENEEESRAAYRAAYEKVKALIRRHGEPFVWELFRKDESEWMIEEPVRE